MNRNKPTLLFISQWGEPGTYDPRLWCRMPGGDDETAWFRGCLEAAGVLPEITYRAVRAPLGESLPEDLAAIDAVVLGGSIASVHDDYPWQRRITGWLEAWRRTKRPLFGICGGQQLVCRMLGAEVEAVPGGVEAGSLPVSRTPAGERHFLFEGFAPEARFHFGNGERVAAPPAGSTVLATRPRLPAAALDHGGGWLSVQFHPELTADVFATYWSRNDPAKAELYRPVLFCERMLRNFLVGTGVTAA